MAEQISKLEADRQMLREARAKGGLTKLGAYAKLSGPGWLQSAVTLGGGSLGGSLYLGVLTGVSMMWLQPLAMILGIIMLSAIAYVTTSTRVRPFAAINQINPVLGWSWALASLAANMVWCLPQFALANSVLQQNLFPETLGVQGSLAQAAQGWLGTDNWVAINAGKLAITAGILIITVAITWAYNSGSWGIKMYELVLKLMVAMIVLCFFGVAFRIATSPSGLPWGEIFRGFIPDFSSLSAPSPKFQPLLEAVSPEFREFWTESIVEKQRSVMITVAATAVGINMTFLFPYSMLRKGWTKEFRGLAIFDLSTGMLIPFVLATSCVVIAAANQFHTRPVPGFLGETDPQGRPVAVGAKAESNFVEILTPRLKEELGDERFAQLLDESVQQQELRIDPAVLEEMGDSARQSVRSDFEARAIRAQLLQLPEPDRRLAAALVDRDAFDLADSLKILFADEQGQGGKLFADIVFGIGVLGMTLSTITLLMLISGFVICEMFGLPEGGWWHRIGCLAAATGALGPFLWSRAAFYLVVPTSVFGMALLPIAYLSFFLLMNQRSLLGDQLPRGARRWLWNTLMAIAAGVAAAASAWVILTRSSTWVIIGVGVLLLLMIVVQLRRGVRHVTPEEAR